MTIFFNLSHSLESERSHYYQSQYHHNNSKNSSQSHAQSSSQPKSSNFSGGKFYICNPYAELALMAENESNNTSGYFFISSFIKYFLFSPFIFRILTLVVLILSKKRCLWILIRTKNLTHKEDQVHLIFWCFPLQFLLNLLEIPTTFSFINENVNFQKPSQNILYHSKLDSKERKNCVLSFLFTCAIYFIITYFIVLMQTGYQTRSRSKSKAQEKSAKVIKEERSDMAVEV